MSDYLPNSRLLPDLPDRIISYVFGYIDLDFESLIKKNGSSNEKKKLSITIIMKSEMQFYFKELLLGKKYRNKLCMISAGLSLNALEWAHGYDCPWDSSTCSAAAAAGHLHILQWARINNCPWDLNTCSAAAAAGHLHILQWARINNCPWDSNT
jgi:hypothetical protein